MSILKEFEKQEEQRPYVDRRKRPDWLVRSATIATALGWISAISAIVMLDGAAPAGESFYTRIFDVPVISQWNSSMLRWAFAAILASLFASALGMVLNATRQRRKTDKYNKLLIALCAVSAVLLALFLLRYSVHL